MTKQKGAMSVSKATKDTFDRMPEEFSILDLIKGVRFRTERPSLTDGTITRQLRLLREDQIIDYDVIDNQKAIYKKKGISLENGTKRNQLEIFDDPSYHEK